MTIYTAFIKSNDTKFTYNFQHQLKNVSHIRVINVKIPNTSYNITTENNSITYIHNNNSYINTISAGMYNITTLISALNAQLQHTQASYNSITGKISFTNNADIQTSSTIKDIIGYPNGGTTATELVNLTSNNLYLEVSNLDVEAEIFSHKHNIIYEAIMDVPSNSIYSDNNKDGLFISLNKSKNVSNIKFRLLDEKMNLVDLNNVEFSFSIQLQSE
jgi:hypothetical protein